MFDRIRYARSSSHPTKLPLTVVMMIGSDKIRRLFGVMLLQREVLEAKAVGGASTVKVEASFARP
jgi:hypothetical protein